MVMRTPDKKKPEVSSFNALETPRTEASSSMKTSAGSMKHEKSPNTMMNQLSLDNSLVAPFITDPADLEKNRVLAEAFKNNTKGRK